MNTTINLSHAIAKVNTPGTVRNPLRRLTSYALMGAVLLVLTVRAGGDQLVESPNLRLINAVSDDINVVNSFFSSNINISGSFSALNSAIILANGSVGGSFRLTNSGFFQGSNGVLRIAGSFHSMNSNLFQTSGSEVNLRGSFHSMNSRLFQTSGSEVNLLGSFELVNSDIFQLPGGEIRIGGNLNSNNSEIELAGVLNVDGDYIQQRESRLTINPFGTPVVFGVGGKAQLSGDLQVTIDPAFKRYDSITILTAAGGVTGEFESFNNPYPRQPGKLLYFSLNYQPQGVFLEVLPNDFKNVLSLFSLTANQSATAAALDGALFDRRQDAVLTYLDGFDISAIPALLDQIAPEELGALYSIGFARTNNSVASLQNRFADIRSSREESFTALQETNLAPSSSKNANKAAVLTPPARKRYGSFTTVSGDFSSSGNTDNASGYDSESGLLLSGFDVRISDPLTLGVLVGYTRTESDLNNGGEVGVDGGSLALYGQYVRDGWFVESMVGGSYNSYDTERQALNGIASGDTQGGGFDAYLSLGRDLKRDSLTVTPFASLLYSRVGIDGYDENGSLQPLYLESQAADSLFSRIGIRVAQTFMRGDAVITPYASAQWQHECLDDASAVDYRFSNGSGGKSTAYGPDIGRNSLVASGGLQIAWKRYACDLSYQADLGRENYENQTVLAGFRVSW